MERRKVGNSNLPVNNLYDTDDSLPPMPLLRCSEERGALEVDSVVHQYHAWVMLCFCILAGLGARNRDGAGLKDVI